MHGQSSVHDALESFLDDGWISEVLHEVKSGKEATVYCCRAGERPGNPAPGGSGEFALVAAKVHRDLETRRFRNDSIYQTGRVHLAREGRVKRAADRKSAFGRKVQSGMWIEHEWETLNLLHASGLPVPEPLARNDRAILMTYLGDESTSAPNLVEADLSREDAARTADALIRAVTRMLDLDRVHGDLSPYNVLWWSGRATIIDFPQSIDPRLNPAARTLFARDMENICAWAKKRGVPRDPQPIIRNLWRRFTVGEIG